jgi:HD superfamily phosphodiesterase
MKTIVMKKMIDYFQNDVKRINHALKVFDFAQIISEDENIDKKTREVIIYASILHDIGIKEAGKKYNSSIGKFQEIEGPPIAREILSDLKIDEKIIERVCVIIGNHHSYSKVEGIDFQIVVEADYLVNIFEDDLNQKAIENINANIFKTQYGRKLIKTMYI